MSTMLAEATRTETTLDIDPKTVRAWLDEGRAVLVDVREADEHARERIPGARSIPLSRLSAEALADAGDRLIVFQCSSGNRSREACARVDVVGGERSRHLAGGIAAWKAAGLPVERDEKAPLPLMRQVQITAGSLVLLGALLASLVHPGFIALSAFVGAGLVLAGVTGVCGMANLLALLPYNRRRTA
jgi:rhodanese-related sulfurtransferase